MPDVAEDLDRDADDDGCPEEDAPAQVFTAAEPPSGFNELDSDDDDLSFLEPPLWPEDEEEDDEPVTAPEPVPTEAAPSAEVAAAPIVAPVEEPVEAPVAPPVAVGPDADGDGVPDAEDACRDTPGDPADEGCPPPPDLDRDGIYDPEDRCMDQPETVNGFLDDDGCPDDPQARVRVSGSRLELEDSIAFEPASTILLDTSRGMLDEVVALLKGTPHWQVRIEGHTDSAGNDTTNMELSKGRAEAVATYLVDRGIDRSRLTAIGFGEARPLDTNRTASGRARNRRVEFHIIE